MYSCPPPIPQRSAPGLFVLCVATHRLLFRLVAYTLYVTQTRDRSPQNDLLARFIISRVTECTLTVEVDDEWKWMTDRKRHVTWPHLPGTPDPADPLPSPPLYCWRSHDFHPLPLPTRPRKTHFVVYAVGHSTCLISPPAAMPAMEGVGLLKPSTVPVLPDIHGTDRLTVHVILFRAYRSPCDRP